MEHIKRNKNLASHIKKNFRSTLIKGKLIGIYMLVAQETILKTNISFIHFYLGKYSFSLYFFNTPTTNVFFLSSFTNLPLNHFNDRNTHILLQIVLPILFLYHFNTILGLSHISSLSSFLVTDVTHLKCTERNDDSPFSTL